MTERGKREVEATRSEADWEESARLLRVMAHPIRLQILDALCEKSRCVKDLNALVHIPQPHLSQHMAALRKAEIVASHSDGSLRCYYILRPTLVDGLRALVRERHRIQRRDPAAVQREARGEVLGQT